MEESSVLKLLIDEVGRAGIRLLELREECRDYVETSVDSPVVFEPSGFDRDGLPPDQDSAVLSEVTPVHLRFSEGTPFTHRSELYPVAVIPRGDGVRVACRAYDERRNTLGRGTWEFSVDDIADPEGLLSFILRFSIR